MKNLLFITLLYFFLIPVFSQNTFYTTGLGNGEWSDPQSWSLSENGTEPAGSPLASDHVVIRHYLTHRAEPGYTHTGNVSIQSSGTYEIVTGIENPGPYIFAGELFEAEGTLITISDFYQQNPDTDKNSKLHFISGSLIYINGNLALHGNAEVVADNKTCGATEISGDLWLKSTDVTICGEGSFVVNNRVRAWDVEKIEIEPTPAGLNYIQSLFCKGFNVYQSAEDCENEIPALTGSGLLRPFVKFESPELELFPNPISGSNVSLKADGFEADVNVSLTVRNLLGQTISTSSLHTDNEGYISQTLSHNLQPGTYVMIITSSSKRVAKQLRVL
ncbi:MAG: T9SS type A sorting domain-containing protein [Bacteroidia bacterium]|nr:T9SS type A sorting domain-containing protein [Bacteroidia bacterium]